MSILSIQTVQTGLVGVLPSLAYISTNDTEATILVTGYLNHEVALGTQFSLPCIAVVSTQETPTSQPDVGWYQVSKVGTNWSLVSSASPGDVTLPTIVNHIAVYTNAQGGLGEDAANAINAGNIQAGLSGTAGGFVSFSATPAKGYLALQAVANSGDFATIISNAQQGQISTYSIPDCGASTANFIISAKSGTQNITVGSLQVNAGNITAGSSGNAGSLISFPPTAANGTLILAAANAGGAFNTSISNGSMGQSTVYTLGDIGATTGGVVVATSAIRMKSVAGAANGGGNAAQTFTDAFCTSGSNVIGNWNTQANTASVLKIVPGNGSFVVTSSADAGVGTFNYIITK